jgi:hypothetical protein
MPRNRRLLISLPPDLDRWVATQAEATGVSQAEIIRRAVRDAKTLAEVLANPERKTISGVMAELERDALRKLISRHAPKPEPKGK